MPAAFDDHQLKQIERTTQEIGRYLFDHLERQRPTMLERRWWDDRIMAWAMQDESVKVQMFRFIDVLPMLLSGDAVTRHLHEYFQDVREHLPSAARLGLAVAAPNSIAGRALALAARRNAMGHARRFIAGTNQSEVLVAAMRQRKLKRAFTLDVLGEAVTSEPEADKYLQAYLELIEGIAPTVNAWPEVPQIDRGDSGELPRVNVSVKLSALDSQFDPIDPEGTTRRVGERLRKLLRCARGARAFVNVDMESYHTKDLTLAIFQQILMEDEFRDWGDVGIVIQGYLKDSAADLRALRDWACLRGQPIWVRLVKGAYWDYETLLAQAIGWPIPVFEQKWETDANYERLTEFALLNHEHLHTALGSHNLRSLAHGMAVARHLGLPQTAFELQMLYGMADAEKQALVDLDYRLRIYMPYGELIPGMAYLVRRLLENTSNESFLRASFAEHSSAEKLLMNPVEFGAKSNSNAAHQRDVPHPFSPTLANEPPADFGQEANRQSVRDALAADRAKWETRYPLVIGGQEISTTRWRPSTNPSHKSLAVGIVADAGTDHVQAAVKAAKQALPGWSALPAEQRAQYLRRAAQAMRERRFELAACEVHECAKAWREADADVCEAIDFCEYYAAGAIELARPHGVDVPGEENRFEYLPRGVAAVIAPWNFPLAILTGMTTAALATGNTVVMKPAEQSAVIAAHLMNIFREVDLPTGVLNFLPGPGETVGAALVDHPDIALIAFTGSRAVGLAINARAAQVSSATNAKFVKHVIAEMGGKNAIIVDDDADLDEAVSGVVKSAFGYQGQKCSACSRVIVLEGVYNAFVERLVEATRSLKIGPKRIATSVSAVIDAEALDRVRRYIDIGRQTGREALAMDAGSLAEEGFFVGPHIFTDVPVDGRLAQEEVFGPVLAVFRAKNMDEAIQIFNGTDYALTGGIFSRSPEHFRRARRELIVGNLYLNRGITGALVGRQPFGGFKMSGIGTKAGGADYLLQFVLPRTVTENTMRRGFAPPPRGGE